MKKYTIIIGLLSFCFYGISQKIKTTVINQFTYTQSPEKLDFLEYQVLKNKDKLNYNLIIEKADGLTQEDINKISNIDVLEGITKTENSNAEIHISQSILDLEIGQPFLDSAKEKIGKEGYSVKQLMSNGVEVFGMHYKSNVSYTLETNIVLDNEKIYKNSNKYKVTIQGKSTIPKSIITDTLYKGIDSKKIDKIIGSRLLFNRDPFLVFSASKDSILSNELKKTCESRLSTLKTLFCNSTKTLPKLRLYTFKKKKTDFEDINNAVNSLVEKFNKNKKINISNYSESDKQNIKKHASIIENEIKSNYDFSSESLLTERYSNEAILGLYKALALCYFSLSDFEKISIVDKHAKSIVDNKTYDKYYREIYFASQESYRNGLKEKKIAELKALKAWIQKNPNFQDNQVLRIKYNYIQKQLKDKSFSVDDFLNAPKLLNESNYKQIVFNIGKDSQDTLWATSLDSLVLNGLYIDSANKITKKIFYDNGKIKTKTLVKYSNEDQKIYERTSTYVGDTSDQINYVVELNEWHEQGSSKRVSNWNETVERGGTYAYDPSKGEYVRKTQDYFRAKVEEWYENGQQRIVASYMLLEGAENYDENDLTGDYLEWHKNGQQKIKTNYTWNSQGKIHAQIQGKYEEWYENGQQKQLGNYQPNLFAGGGSEALTMIGFLKMANIHGCVYGDLTQWYENGNKKTEMTAYMKEGFGFTVISTGTKRSWYENGQIKKEVAYGTHSADERKTNPPISEKSWDADGNVKN